MDVSRFVRAVDQLDEATIRDAARRLDRLVGSPRAEVTATRALVDVERAVRGSTNPTWAALSGASAAQNVRNAARRCRMPVDHPDVARVARAAALVARATAAGAADDPVVAGMRDALLGRVDGRRPPTRPEPGRSATGGA